MAALLAWDQVVPLLLPLPLVVAANLAERGDGSELTLALRRAVLVVLALIAAGCALVGVAVLGGVGGLRSGTSGRLAVYGALLVATGLVAAVLCLEPARGALERFLPISRSSLLDTTALVLTVVLVGTQLAAQVSLNVLAQTAGSARGLGPLDLLAQELPFLLAGALGVGLFTRRSPRDSLRRLGLVRPALWQMLAALAAAGAFYAFATGADALAQWLTPGLSREVQSATGRLFGGLGNPVGIATIALAAGICEETLFRGALQPRLGLVWTALVFAAVHTQYGITLDALAVFMLALGLGLLRRYANTTTSVTCHVVYNALAGVGVGGLLLLPAICVEAALVVGALLAFSFTTRVGAAAGAG